MNEFVLNGLVKRRAELAGDIENTHEALRKMVLDLESLDATIVQFDSDFKVETIKPKAFRPPKDWSNRCQMSRIILSILRQAIEPLTTRDIALQLLIERALDKSDQRLLRLMTKRVGVALRGQRGNGLVRCDQGPGQYMLWTLVNDLAGGAFSEGGSRGTRIRSARPRPRRSRPTALWWRACPRPINGSWCRFLAKRLNKEWDEEAMGKALEPESLSLAADNHFDSLQDARRAIGTTLKIKRTESEHTAAA